MSFIENSSVLGGIDDEQLSLETNKEEPYFNKRNHFLRSLAHQPNHSKHASIISGPLLEIPREETRSRLPEEWLKGHLPIKRSRNQK